MRFLDYLCMVYQMEVIDLISFMKWFSQHQSPTFCAVSLCAGVGVLADRNGSKSDFNLKRDEKLNCQLIVFVFRQALELDCFLCY